MLYLEVQQTQYSVFFSIKSCDLLYWELQITVPTLSEHTRSGDRFNEYCAKEDMGVCLAKNEEQQLTINLKITKGEDVNSCETASGSAWCHQGICYR